MDNRSSQLLLTVFPFIIVVFTHRGCKIFVAWKKIAVNDETFCNDTLPDAHLGPGCSLIKAVKSLLSEKRL